MQIIGISQKTIKRLLCLEMSRISEEYYSSGWIQGLEFILWAKILGNSNTQLQDDEISSLKELSQACGGWFFWKDENANYPEFIALTEWELLFKKRAS